MALPDDLQEKLSHIRQLYRDIERKLPGSSTEVQRLRNELAGMFAVTIVATYEGIVRDALIDYAGRFHEKYKRHVANDFQKMNARISLDDLRKYSRNFGLKPWTGHRIKKNSTTFHKILEEKKPVIERRFRADLFQSYKNLFQWRNDYAHERSANATLKDVYDSHRVAQHVILIFVKSFKEG